MRERLDASAEDCGCGPTPREKRLLFPDMNRRAALGLAAGGMLALGAFGAVGGPFISRAAAIEGYPSWDDVEAARANETAKGAEITRIQTLIQQLSADVDRTRAAAEAASAEFFEAQQAFFDASYRADQLQLQADAEAGKATEAASRAGKVAAQLYRTGGDDTSLELFFSGSATSADDLLARLGTMDKLVERNNDVYAAAITARDSAQSLSDQASVARTERDRLQQVADEKMRAAQAASDAAQAALDAQSTHLIELQAQLAALQDTTAQTVADYEAGVAEEKRRREEAERLAREEAERRAREEAERRAAEEAANAGNNGGGGGNSGGGGGSSGGGGNTPVGSGWGVWARPSWGHRSSGYGPRTVQCGNSYCSSGFHYGVDLASGCAAPIYAASAGRVTYAGYNGGYGNYIRIDHGNGFGTGYGHIMPGGIHVSYGQNVEAGQQIASEGNTGNSFGCHLHFETYIWGAPVNPIAFMAERGISV